MGLVKQPQSTDRWNARVTPRYTCVVYKEPYKESRPLIGTALSSVVTTSNPIKLRNIAPELDRNRGCPKALNTQKTYYILDALRCVGVPCNTRFDVLLNPAITSEWDITKRDA